MQIISENNLGDAGVGYLCQNLNQQDQIFYLDLSGSVSYISLRNYFNKGKGIAFNRKHSLELRSVTCRICLHSITCRLTEVNAPRFNPSQTDWYSIYLPRKDWRLSWSWCWLSYLDALPVRRLSPFPSSNDRESNPQPHDRQSVTIPLRHQATVLRVLLICLSVCPSVCWLASCKPYGDPYCKAPCLWLVVCVCPRVNALRSTAVVYTPFTRSSWLDELAIC